MASEEKATKHTEGEQALTAPSISLPKGGGAIRGMGEKFAANPVTGTGSMSVPIASSPGRAGFGPQLSLAYDSGAGNGPFGFGWSLSLPQISRKTDKGLPQYFDPEESDVFLLSGAEDLVPLLDQDGSRSEDNTTALGFTVHRYRPRIEGLFARIERWTHQSDGDVHWRSLSQDNILTLYGKDADSRIADPENPRRIFTWLICETRDDKGNAVLYEYKPEDGAGVDLTQVRERNRGDANDPRRTANRYLKHIRYGNRQPLLDDEGQRPPFLAATQIQDAGWMFEVVFDYDEHDADAPTPDDAGQWTYRDDPFSTYRAGFEVRTTRLCQRVLMFHHFPDEAERGVGNDCLVRSTDFTYSHEQDPAHARNPVYTFLRAVTQSGYTRENSGYLKRSLPPVEFEYTQPIVQDTVEEVDVESLENLPIGLDGAAYQWTDLHGEGIPGILTEQGGAWFYKRNLSPINVKSGNGTSHTEAKFAPVELVATKPNLALAGGAQFMDLAGDGQPDLVVLDGPMPGLYEHDGDEGWQPFRPFTARLNRDMRDPNLKFVDLDGDGHADVLITEDDTFVWHPSLTEEGFGPARRVHQALDEDKGPRLVFGDGTESIYLADMSGDRLTDLVRICNGEICYWPNLGYGRFGAKITMDHSPHFDHPDQFDQKRIRLADIDGTGTTDIIYLQRDGVRLYFNQSGNSWSEPQVLHVFPRVDDVVSMQPIDLLGNGTACLVWSSPLPGDARRPMRYVDLMGGQKPHLLIKTANNLGAETRVHYAPSTKFYLQDKRNGTPWITRLPFPVHVVERTETFDHISRNRFVTRYAYHHGYFDGIEREFHGFGLVEQFDTEEFAALSGSADFPTGDNIDAASHVPPVHTKTWFHTGAYIRRDHISDFFAGLLDEHNLGEYYREPDLTDPQFRDHLLPDTHLPPGLTLEEEREACRALKGMMLRQEVYADDAPPEATEVLIERARTPYTVVEQDFTIRPLQPRAGNRHAVFFTHPREAMTYHYERDPADPRIQHALTLEVDVFGNGLKEAAIGYGRRQPDSDLPTQADQDKQAQTLITYTENRVTNAIDSDEEYRTPLPCETRTYELTGYTPSGPAGRFQFADLVQPDPDDPDRLAHIFDSELPYEAEASSGRQRRLIEHVCTLYRPDDLGAAQNDPLTLLPLGTVEPLVLPGESYQLAFTPGLLAQVFQRDGQPLLANPATVLGGQGADGGGYVDLDNNGHWWIPAARVFLSPNSNDTATQELAFARQHFFLPQRYHDPFHTAAFSTESFITYDTYDLLMVETRDALENRVTVGERTGTGEIDPNIPGNDYRILQPRLVTDPNRNRTEVAFDALGMVVGTAVMGKSSPASVEGDSLDGFEADLTEAVILDHLQNPLADPHAILQRTTTRLVYDLFAYDRTRDQPDPQPAVVYTLARETHDADLPTGQQTLVQHSFSYSDGFGREIQQKIQAEPGSAPQRDAEGNIIVGTNGQPEMTGHDVDPRWVGSGWTVFNNKEKPVRQYEPFFTDTHRFEFDVRIGVSPVLFYDPVERVVATLHPNHTWEKVIFDPWRQASYDVNDTVLINPAEDPEVGDLFRRLPEPDYLPSWHSLRTDPAHTAVAAARWPEPQQRADEADAAAKAAAHADTPALVHFDSLGRPFLSIADNGPDEQYRTRTEQDIEGAPLRIIDDRANVVMAYQVEVNGDPPVPGYDVAGRQVYENSMDAGERWMLSDVTGTPIRAWNSRGHTFRTEYDPLRRPLRIFVTGANPANPDDELLTERLVYGEQHPEAELRNLRGAPYLHLDQAGAATSEAHDFKGNPLHATRRLAREYKRALDWTAIDAVIPPASTATMNLAALEAALAPLLEDETFTTETAYDALNRPVAMTTPDNSVIVPTYNEANLLEQLAVRLRGADQATLFVADIDYNAKGQRERIEYANGAITDYSYDLETFRLTRLRTIRPAFPPNARVLQDLNYAYDPGGNITSIRDDAQQTVFFSNVQVLPHNDYIYDAIYRLIQAEGREHAVQNNLQRDATDFDPIIGIPFPNSPEALQPYVEEYAYDGVGNILSMTHTGGGSVRWKRCYQYAQDSNRLVGTSGGGAFQTQPCPEHYIPGAVSTLSEQYQYDAHGNMIRMSHLPLMQWNFKDQLQASSQQVVSNGGTPETTYYVYDAAGQRVRKLTERFQPDPNQAPTRRNERIYIGGFEVYREYNGGGGNVTLERETLHVMDDQQRVAQIDTRTQGNDDAPAESQRFQLSNHLGSAMLEIDEQANVISYEEYHSYGTSAYRAGRSAAEVSLKRYRYTGKERDEETGLYYHGARYYACWLGRWNTADPIGLGDGVNRYAFVRNNPILLRDSTGTLGLPSWDDVVETAKSVAGSVAERVAEDPGGAYVDYLKATILEPSRFVGRGLLENAEAAVHALAHPVDTALAIKDQAVQDFSDTVEGVQGVVGELSEGNIVEAGREYLRAAKGVWGLASLGVGGAGAAAGGAKAVKAVKAARAAKAAKAAKAGSAPVEISAAEAAELDAVAIDVSAQPALAGEAIGEGARALGGRVGPQKALPPTRAERNRKTGKGHESDVRNILEKIADTGTSVIEQVKIQVGKYRYQYWQADFLVQIRGVWNIFDAKPNSLVRTAAQRTKIPVFEQRGGRARKPDILPTEGVDLPPSRVREITPEVVKRFMRIFGIEE